MRTSLLKVALPLVAAVAVLTVAERSDAGASMGNGGASCSRASDYSGQCSGTLRGFRSSADPNAQAYFLMQAGSYESFSATLNNVGYYCSVPASSPMTPAFQAATSAKTQLWFYISWNSSGQCTYLQVYNASTLM